MTISELLQKYQRAKPDLSAGWRRQLKIAVKQLNELTGCELVEDLHVDRLDEFRERLLIFGRKAVTINHKTDAILSLWRFAKKRGLIETEPADIEPLVEAKRIPRAWNTEEMARILEACDTAPMRRTWGPAHWRALVLVIYDTSMRIGCLLKSPRSVVQGDLIAIPAELQKGEADTIHRLHSDTVDAIGKLPGNTRLLFHWPYHENEIWPKFRKDILERAGLNATRADMFHKIRKTSYTLVYVKYGLQAATEHAAHTCDLSKNYLDPTFVERPDPLEALPRPTRVLVPRPDPEPEMQAIPFRIVG